MLNPPHTNYNLLGGGFPTPPPAKLHSALHSAIPPSDPPRNYYLLGGGCRTPPTNYYLLGVGGWLSLERHPPPEQSANDLVRRLKVAFALAHSLPEAAFSHILKTILKYRRALMRNYFFNDRGTLEPLFHQQPHSCRFY